MQTNQRAHNFRLESHSALALNYHLIICVKYRRRVLCFPEIIQDLKLKTEHLCNCWNIKLIAFGSDKNHIHMLIECPSDFPLPKFVNNYKAVTSKNLRSKYPFLIRAMKKNLWSGSYCAITTGIVNLNTVKEYVLNQGRYKKDI